MSKEYSLLVRTNSYTGNTDTTILGALFGYDDERYGGKFGETLWKNTFTTEEQSVFEDLLGFRYTEYGSTPYSINDDFNDEYNTLEIFLNSYGDRAPIEEIGKCVELWRDKYNGVLNIVETPSWSGDTSKKYSIELHSFHLKTIITSTDIEEIL